MKIIPAIDIINGRCVRLSQGDYDRITSYGTPEDMALTYQKAGFSRLHVVDLDGAKASHVVNAATIATVCRMADGLMVDVSGGIKSDEDIEMVFSAGASYACVGSMAYTDTEKVKEWIERYGADRIIIGADVKDGFICTHGWKNVTSTTIYDFMGRYDGMIKRFMCTDISRDGMLGGTAVDLYGELMNRYPDMTLVASGGVSCTEDLDALEKIGVKEVIVGKAIYENRISLDELLKYEQR